MSQILKHALFGLLIFSTSSCATEVGIKQSFNSSFEALVDKKRKESELIGLSAFVVTDGIIIESAASGEREKGSGVAVSTQDEWHIGSISKSFTATLIARLIDRDVLSWDTKISDVFQDLHNIDKSWLNVTLKHLLSHTSGAEPNFSLYTSLFGKPDRKESIVEFRKSEVLDILEDPTENEPGKVFNYSNLGYIIAASMVEEITGTSWSDLVSEEVLKPLKLQSAGFGPPKDIEGELEQPRGHRTLFGFVSAVDTEPYLSPILAPAGGLHMTLADLAAYATDHLRGELGKGQLLPADSYKLLHTPVMNEYGYGWATKPGETWSNGPVIWHNGSNTTWYALVAILPGLNSVIVVASNDGNVAVAEKAAWEIVRNAADIMQKNTAN